MRRSVPVVVLVFLLPFFLLSQAFGFTFPKHTHPFKPSKKGSSEVLSVEEDISQRSEYSTVFKTKVRENGKVRDGKYTQLTPGLFYNAGTKQNPEFKKPDTNIVLNEQGAVVERIGQPIRFSKSLNFNQPVIEQTLDGSSILSATPELILYRDTKTDRTVVLAHAVDAGLAIKNNIATYENAFSGLHADLRYTVDPAQVEQDVLLYEKPEAPSAYGLNNETTQFVVLTRLFHLDSDNPTTIHSWNTENKKEDNQHASGNSATQGWAKVSTDTNSPLRGARSDNVLEDATKEAIYFDRDGKMVQGFARSYALDGKTRHPVDKRIVTLQGMHFLAEEIPAKLILEQDLPQVPHDVAHKPIPFKSLDIHAHLAVGRLAEAAPGKKHSSSASQNATSHQPGKNPQEVGKLAQLSPSEKKDMNANSAPSSTQKVFIMDYISVSGGTISADYTFEQFQTYFISGKVVFTGDVTFEGGATIKFDDAVASSLDVYDAGTPQIPINTTAHTAQWTVFTHWEDDTYGEAITSSSGTPANYDFALETRGGEIRNAMFLYATEAIRVYGANSTLDVEDSVFIANVKAINATTNFGDATLNLKNLLINSGIDGIVTDDTLGNDITVDAHNLTFVDMTGSAFNTTMSTGSTLNVNDTLFDNITNDNYFSGTSPTQQNFNAACCTTALPAGSGPSGQTNQNVLLSTTPIVDDFFLVQTLAPNGIVDAGSRTATDADMFFHRTDKDGKPEADTQVDIGFHLAPLITDFAVFAANSIWIKNNAYFEGHVGVNRPEIGSGTPPEETTLYDNDGPDEDIELVISDGVTVDPKYLIVADAVQIDSGATVDGEIYYKTGFTNNGTVTTTPHPGAVLPIMNFLPIFRDAVFQTTPSDFTAPDDGTTLIPGTTFEYDEILVKTGATLHVPTGRYNVNKITLQDGAKLVIDGAVDFRVKETIVVGDNAIIEPDDPTTLSTNGMLFYVANDATTPAARAVDFGDSSFVLGIYYANDGTVWLGQGAAGQGIFIGKDVLMDQDSETISNPGNPPRVFNVSFSPNGGSILDTDNITLSTSTPGASIYYTTDGSDPVPATPPVAPTELYSSPFTLDANPSVTVKAIATLTGWTNSTINSATFNVTPETVDPVAASPAPTGQPVNEQTIALSSTTSGATIYFTTDGTDPIEDPEDLYSGGFLISKDTTIKAFATKMGVSSAITTFTYKIIPGLISAPPLVDNVVYNVASNTKFLYTGSNPEQTGVDLSKMDDVRAAVVRGRVMEENSSGNLIPLPGVKVEILNHSEFGETLTRADGYYDMAVNGGGNLTLKYSISGKLPAQRKVETTWQDFSRVDDLVMVPADTNPTIVNLATITSITEATGTPVTAVMDADGARTSMLLFRPGTTANWRMADGTTQAVSGSLTVRATEYTVGKNGLAKMPAPLPPTTAYTYAVEYSVDELPSNATSIEFSGEPVYAYVDNFLKFQSGYKVPSGFYDPVKGKWESQESGITALVISETNGMVDLDLNGNEQYEAAIPGDGIDQDEELYAVYGITDAERTKLAGIYDLKDSFWRTPITHFCFYDLNYPRVSFENDANEPNNEEATGPGSDVPDNCTQCPNNSIIQAEGQIFGEEVSIPGTPFSLHYNSDRVQGSKGEMSLDIPLIGGTIPSSLRTIDLFIKYAGRLEFIRFDNDPNTPENPDIVANMVHHFDWDGFDAYGRKPQGTVPVKIDINYGYEAAYGFAPDFGQPAQGFIAGLSTANGGNQRRVTGASSSGTGKIGGGGPAPLEAVRLRAVFIRPQTYTAELRQNDFRSIGLGGWTLNAQHVYDAFASRVHLGTGPRRSPQTLQPEVETFYLRQGTEDFQLPILADTDPAGNVYVYTDFPKCDVFKFKPDGTREQIMGGGTGGCFSTVTDGANADMESLRNVAAMDVDSEGNIYLLAKPTTNNQNSLVKIDNNNPRKVHYIINPSVNGNSGDGGPALTAKLNLRREFSEVDVDDFGNIFISDTENNKIRKINPAGIISTYAGTGAMIGTGVTNDDLPDGELATTFPLSKPSGIALDKTGNLFVYSGQVFGYQGRIIKISPDGIATIVSGGFGGVGTTYQPTDGVFSEGVSAKDYRWDFFTNDNLPPREFGLEGGLILSIDKQNNLYFWFKFKNEEVSGNQTEFIIKKITAEGIVLNYMITTEDSRVGGPFPEGENLRRTFRFPDRELTFLPDSSAIFPERGNGLTSGNQRLTRISNPLPEFDGDALALPSEDGSMLYLFDATGRHQETRNTLTGALIYDFIYDQVITDRLIEIEDGDGDKTLFAYDSNGELDKITSADGQVTEITIPGPDDYIKDIIHPDGATFSMTYTEEGLMDSFEDPKDNKGMVTYNQFGQMTKDTDPRGGFLETIRTKITDGYEVDLTTGENRTQKFKVITKNGVTTRENTDSNGLVTTTTLDASQSQTIETPDGTETVITKVEDPRFGMEAPLQNLKITLPNTSPSQLVSEITTSRSITGLSANDILDFNTITDTLSINGRTFTSVFDQTTTPKKFTDTSAVGRITTTEVDDQGRITKSIIPEILDTTFAYDTRGRLETITQGTGADERVSTIKYYDDATPGPQQGFVEFVTDAEGRKVEFTYDKVGRVKTQKLPDDRIISFDYDANGNVKSITPPGRPEHKFDYNAVDLEDEYTPPDISLTEHRTRFVYNLDKQPVGIVRPDSDGIVFKYESGGRLDKFEVQSGLSIDANGDLVEGTLDTTHDFTYNATTGTLDKITAPGDQKLDFTYNGSLPLSTTWSRGSFIVGTVSRTYDNSFRITSRTASDNASTPNEEVARFVYDDDDLLTSAKYDPDGTAGSDDEYELALTYDEAGEITAGTANGLLETTEMYDNASPPVKKITDDYLYNDFGEMEEYSASYLTSERFKTVFERDKLGRITKKTETLNGSSISQIFVYEYDDAGRLEVVKEGDTNTTPTVVRTYGYDDNSNRETIHDGNNVLIFQADYDDQDRLDFTGPESNKEVEYDYTANGELDKKTDNRVSPAEVTDYDYDVLGNLKKVTLPDSTVIDYLVDGRNRRIGKKVDGTLERQWLYKDQLNPIAELDGSGNITKRFIYASRANVPDVMVDVSGTNPVVYRIIVDHLGSPRFIINTSTGTTALSIEYDEWGNEQNVQFGTGISRDFIPFGFAGGLYDEDTKLVRFGARDYDPEIGRWTSKDPIRFRGRDSNLFGYVLSNPNNFIDPTGKIGFAIVPFVPELVPAAVVTLKFCLGLLGLGVVVDQGIDFFNSFSEGEETDEQNDKDEPRQREKGKGRMTDKDDPFEQSDGFEHMVDKQKKGQGPTKTTQPGKDRKTPDRVKNKLKDIMNQHNN